MSKEEEADHISQGNEDMAQPGVSKTSSINISFKAGNKRANSEEKPVAMKLKEKKSETSSISMNLTKKKPSAKDDCPVIEKKGKLASVFNNDSESDEEEMPLECKMKMRNIGRDTITSSGPNSFNKGKDGFSNNSYKKFELSMKPRNGMEKKL